MSNITSNSDIVFHALQAVKEVIGKFQSNPYEFLYECDLQCELYSELKKRINDEIMVPASGGNKYRMGVVYSEYFSRIDLVCLDPEKICSLGNEVIKPHKGDDTYIYNLPVLVGIELKYFMMGYLSGFDALHSDKKKLDKIQRETGDLENWLVLGFAQDEKRLDAIVSGTEDRREKITKDSVSLNTICIVSPNDIYAYF